MINRFLSLALAALAALTLAGCLSGKGIDKTLATESEATYRPSLNEAWADMTQDQQEAYNWAVQNLTLESLHSQVKDPTPRRVVTHIADKWIAVWSKEIDELEVDLIKKKAVFDEQEATLKQVNENLAKITAKVTWVGIKDSFFKKRVATVVYTNASPYNLASASFRGVMFIDGETQSDRFCKFTEFFSIRGGLRAGQTYTDTVDIERGMDCNAWSTLAAKNAKSTEYVIKVLPDQVKDFNEKRILPVYEQSREQYQSAIKERQELIEGAKRAKSTMAG